MNFYDIFGQRIMTQVDYTTPTYSLYFGSRLIRADGVAVVTDRLGSVRAGAGSNNTHNFLPYGVEQTATTDQRVKFGTYFRDFSGLLNRDYADQRYYDFGYGRFNTADPTGAKAANASDPGSWNMYAYTGGDPVNRADPSGLEWCDPVVSLSEGCDPGTDPGTDCSFDPSCYGGSPPVNTPPLPSPCDPPSVVNDLAFVLGPGESAGCVSGTPGVAYEFGTSLARWNQLAAGSNLLPELAGAAGSGTIVLGGQTIGWEIIVTALGVPEVILTVAGVAAVALLYEAATKPKWDPSRDTDCQRQSDQYYAHCIQSGKGKGFCAQEAKEIYVRCMKGWQDPARKIY